MMATAIQQEIKTHSPRGYKIISEGLCASFFGFSKLKEIYVSQHNYDALKQISHYTYTNKQTAAMSFFTDNTCVAIFKVKPKKISSKQ